MEMTRENLRKLFTWAAQQGSDAPLKPVSESVSGQVLGSMAWCGWQG
jgi:hypothetical protein